jgi:tetratricopeptide (TPR) repeat protein
MTYLKNATIHDPSDPQYSYVYAIGLNSQNQPLDALNVLVEALQRHPYDRNILYSLSTISMENGKREDALGYAEKLVEYYPEDPNYQQLRAMLSN